MENLPFQEEELDLIWSEGAIYNIGFERGLNKWRKSDDLITSYPHITKEQVFAALEYAADIIE